MQELGQAAQAAAAILANVKPAIKNAALQAQAAALRANTNTILTANTYDIATIAEHANAAFLDRLQLDDKRIEAMASGLEAVAQLPDPIGTVLAAWERPNGLKISRIRVPLGVIGVIYESRPNVTADAGGLCLKSGNAVILRGGSENFHSSTAIASCLVQGLLEVGLPKAAIQLVPTTDRAAVGIMLAMTKSIDVIIPRGGVSLTERVLAESRIPVLKHLAGLCHTYIHRAADPSMARRIVVNAKMRRVGICGATETLLVDQIIASTVLPPILNELIKLGCEIRGDNATQALDPRVTPATPTDWDTEYLDAILSVRQVSSLEDAIAHINCHGSHHTDSIVTEDYEAAKIFSAQVDSGIVLHNASTQFADGGEFGMGAEIGISTGKLHARGPVGVEQLTSYKYVVYGSGQIRP
jgi:glutamate-5-semialdehyde dehydrogenase